MHYFFNCCWLFNRRRLIYFLFISYNFPSFSKSIISFHQKLSLIWRSDGTHLLRMFNFFEKLRRVWVERWSRKLFSDTSTPKVRRILFSIFFVGIQIVLVDGMKLSSYSEDSAKKNSRYIFFKSSFWREIWVSVMFLQDKFFKIWSHKFYNLYLCSICPIK